MEALEAIQNIRMMEISRLRQAMVDFRRAQRSISQLEDAIGVEYGEIVDYLEQYNTNDSHNDEQNQLDAPVTPHILMSIVDQLKEKSYL